jgi:hypothetical protein
VTPVLLLPTALARLAEGFARLPGR